MHISAAVAALLPWTASGAFTRLSDPSYSASATAPLTGWTLHAAGEAVELTAADGVSVPGDLIMDLANAGLAPDPIYEMGWKGECPPWENGTWTYAAPFPAAPARAAATTPLTRVLVVDGLKMGAVVSVDGIEVGRVADEFLRYAYPLPANASGMSVAFPPVASNSAPLTHGRFAACSGGWDWAAYTDTVDVNGTMTFRFVFVGALSHPTPLTSPIHPVPPLPARASGRTFTWPGWRRRPSPP
jgi:beta-mannosidase